MITTVHFTNYNMYLEIEKIVEKTIDKFHCKILSINGTIPKRVNVCFEIPASEKENIKHFFSDIQNTFLSFTE